ncbi:MAG: histidine kinase [Pedobacter sp.]|uniref:sensor histidine kinase n=1 Tax=Pedobacter sp. TaxID=1411316 RepID=UPI0028084006|nr:histidine kinase [Pedobacter sp.]MDQ8003206.1 histidine kinase [Pedobacter sp.]
MTTTPLSKPQIRNIASIVLICWQIACAAVLYFFFNFSWQIAIADSIISNSFLAIGCIVISNMLGFYQPKNEKLLYVLLVTLAVSATVVVTAKYSLTFLFTNQTSYIAFLDLSDIFKTAVSFICLGWCALANILWYRLEEQSEMQERMLATQNLAKEAELNKLRHQLQPHFLFNSLNSVYALTIVNPTEAGTMITKLAAFLRGTLKRDDEVWVSVADEMEYIQLYLDIEKVRFSHRLSVAVNIADETMNLHLPGTLLQPIVENAIKFGLYNTSTAITITLDVKLENNVLVICVTNPYDPEMKASKGTGFGLSAIRRRLYLLFADTTLLQAESQNNNLYITTLKIPQKDDQNHTN